MRKLFVLTVGLVLFGSTVGCGNSEKVTKPKEIQPPQTRSFQSAGEPVGKTTGTKAAAPAR